MSNTQQNKIQNETKQFKKEINLLQDKLKQIKKKQVYCKMGKSESKKCKMGQGESQKCIIKYRIKQSKSKGRHIYCDIYLSNLKKDITY